MIGREGEFSGPLRLGYFSISTRDHERGEEYRVTYTKRCGVIAGLGQGFGLVVETWAN